MTNLIKIVLIIFIIILLITSFLAIYSYYISKETTLPPNQSNCQVATNLLENITNLYCCYIGNTITSSKYVPSLNMVVNPVSIYYLDVCQEFCGTEGINDDKTECINPIYQQEFEGCINLSKPQNCIGLSMPVAINGLTYYYSNSAGPESCQIQKEC